MENREKKKGLSRNISIKSVHKNVTKAVKSATKATIDAIGHEKADLDLSERTATQMAISGRVLKRKPSFQIDANTALIANQSIVSNGLDSLNFDLSTMDDAAAAPAQEQSKFHDPLLDELDGKENEEVENDVADLPSPSSAPTQSEPRQIQRRKSIGLGSVMADIQEPKTPQSFATSGGSSIVESDFDVDEYLTDSPPDPTTTIQVETIIQNYTKSLVACGVDDAKDAVFAIFARHLPQDVKTNYNYEKQMTALLKYFVDTIEQQSNGRKFSLVFITGLSNEQMPKVKWAEHAVKSSLDRQLHERVKSFYLVHLNLTITAYISRLRMFISGDFFKHRLIKCSCLKSLKKHGLNIKLDLADDLAAFDQKKTK